jgi:transposase InsO family protein
VLQNHGIAISMDGKGRALDNVFIQRFWRSLKQEKIYRIDLSKGSKRCDIRIYGILCTSRCGMKRQGLCILIKKKRKLKL